MLRMRTPCFFGFELGVERFEGFGDVIEEDQGGGQLAQFGAVFGLRQGLSSGHDCRLTWPPTQRLAGGDASALVCRHCHYLYLAGRFCWSGDGVCFAR